MAERPSIWGFNPENQQSNLAQTQNKLLELHQQYTNSAINYETYEAKIQEVQGQSPDVFRDAIATYNNPEPTMSEIDDTQRLLAFGSGGIQAGTDLLKYPILAANWGLGRVPYLMSGEQEASNSAAITNYYDKNFFNSQFINNNRNRLREEYPAEHLGGELATGAVAALKNVGKPLIHESALVNQLNNYGSATTSSLLREGGEQSTDAVIEATRKIKQAPVNQSAWETFSGLFK